MPRKESKQKLFREKMKSLRQQVRESERAKRRERIRDIKAGAVRAL